MRKPAKPKHAPRTAPLRRYFALLLNHPEQTIPLDVEHGPAEARQALRFSPGIAVPARNANLGTLELAASAPELTLTTLSDASSAGKTGTGYTLRVLADAPEEFLHWPAPKRHGFYKAFTNALEQLRSTPAMRHREWLAQQFAAAGYASQRALEKVLVRTGESTLPWPGSVAKTAENWIWKDAAAQWVEKLRHDIKQRQRRNHFLDEVHVIQATEWLGLGHPDLAEYVLKAFAPLIHKRPKTYPDGMVVELAGELLPAPPAPRETELARHILASYPAGEGKSLNGLTKAYPSYRHVIAALVEARQLILAPDEYVFTRAQLRGYLKTLAGRTGLSAVPSVRQIKDLLLLERRPAEALRAYLAEMLPVEAPSRARRRR